MCYYVYPAGQTGKLLAAMIEYVEEATVRLIDDAIDGCGLLDYREEILGTHSFVLLAWDKKSGWNDATMQKIVARLEEFGVAYKEDAFEEYANKVINKLKAEISCKGKCRCVGIELGGFAEDKHIGLLDDYLTQKVIFDEKILLVYFCGFVESYKRILEKIKKNNMFAIAVCLSPYDLGLVDCVDVLCKVSWTLKNPYVKTIEIGHSMSNFSEIDLNVHKKHFDYLCIGSREFYPKRDSREVVCLKSGYLAFDRVYGELNGLGYCRRGGGILFDAYNEDEFYEMLPLIRVALKKYKVRFRARFFTQGNDWKHSKDAIDSLLKNPNFSVDANWKMSVESYKDSFVLVCGATTMKYTFPLLALSPSFVLSDASDVLNGNLGVVYSRDISPGSFFKIVQEIDANREIWREKILHYREAVCYNFGNASTYLAEFILKLLKEKHETR